MVDRYSPVPYKNQNHRERQTNRTNRQTRRRDNAEHTKTTKNDVEEYDTETTTGGSTSRGEYETEESSTTDSYSTTIGLTTSSRSDNTEPTASATSSALLNDFLDDLENLPSILTHDDEEDEDEGEDDEYGDSCENLRLGKKEKDHDERFQQQYPQGRRERLNLKVDVGRNAVTGSDQPSLVLSPNEELTLLATRAKPNSPDHTPDQGLKSLNPPNLMVGGKEKVPATTTTPSPTYFDFSPDSTPPFLNPNLPNKSDDGRRLSSNDHSRMGKNIIGTETYDAQRHVDFSPLANTIDGELIVGSRTPENSPSGNNSFINSRDMLMHLKNDDRHNSNMAEESPISAGYDSTIYYSGSSTPGGGNCYDGDDDESPIARPALKQAKTTKQQQQHQLTTHAPQQPSLLSPGGRTAYDGDDDESEPVKQQRSCHPTVTKPRQVTQGRRSASGGPSTQEEPSQYVLSTGTPEAPAPVSQAQVEQTGHNVQAYSSQEELVDRPGAMFISSEPHQSDLARRQVRALSEARRIISLPPTDEEPPQFYERDSPGGRTVSDSSTRNRGGSGNGSRQIYSHSDLYDNPSGQKSRAVTQARRRVSEPVTVEEPDVLSGRHETKPLVDQDSTQQRKACQAFERDDFTHQSDSKTSVEALRLSDVFVPNSVNETNACQSRPLSTSNISHDPAIQHLRRSKANARLSRQPSDGLVQCEDLMQGEPDISASSPAAHQALQRPPPLPPVHHKMTKSGTKIPSTNITESERRARSENENGANLRIVATSGVSPVARGSPSDPYFVSRWKSRLTSDVPQQQSQSPKAGLNISRSPNSKDTTACSDDAKKETHEPTSGILETNPSFMIGKNVGKLKGTAAANNSLNKSNDRNVSEVSDDSVAGLEHDMRQQQTSHGDQVESYRKDEQKVADFRNANIIDGFNLRINHVNKNGGDAQGNGPLKRVGNLDELQGRNAETCNARHVSRPKKADEGEDGPDKTFENLSTGSRKTSHEKNIWGHQMKIDAEVPVRITVCTTPQNSHRDSNTVEEYCPDPMLQKAHDQNKISVGTRNGATYLSSKSDDGSENSSSDDMREGYDGAFPVSIDHPVSKTDYTERSMVHSSSGSESVVDTNLLSCEPDMVNAPKYDKTSSADGSPNPVETLHHSPMALQSDISNRIEDDESKRSACSYSDTSRQGVTAESFICASKSDDGILYSSGEGAIPVREARDESIPKNASIDDEASSNVQLSKRFKKTGTTFDGRGQYKQKLGSDQSGEPKEDGRIKRVQAPYTAEKLESTEEPGFVKDGRNVGGDTNVKPQPRRTKQFGDKTNSNHNDYTKKSSTTSYESRLGSDNNLYPKLGKTKKFVDSTESRCNGSSWASGIPDNNREEVNDANGYSNPWQAKKIESRTDSKHDESFDAPSYGSTRFMRSLASDLTDDSEDINSQDEQGRFVERREKAPDMEPEKKRELVSRERIAHFKQVRKNSLEPGRRSQPQAKMRATSIMMRISESDLTSVSEDLEVQHSEDFDVEYVPFDRCKRAECLFPKPSAGVVVIPGISTSSSGGVDAFRSEDEDDDEQTATLGGRRHPSPSSDVTPVDEGAKYPMKQKEARWDVTRQRFDPSHTKEIDDGPELIQDDEPVQAPGRKLTSTLLDIESPTAAGEGTDTNIDKYSAFAVTKDDTKRGEIDKRRRARASRKPGAVAVNPRVGPEYNTKYDDILVGPFRRNKELEDGPELIRDEGSQRSGRRSIRQIMEDSQLGTRLTAGDKEKKQNDVDSTDAEAKREKPHLGMSASASQPGAEHIKGEEQDSFQKFDNLINGRRAKPESTQITGANGNDNSIDETSRDAKEPVSEDLKVAESTSSEGKYLPSALSVNPPPVEGCSVSTFSWSSILSSEHSSRSVLLKPTDSEEGSGVEARHVETGSQDLASNPSGNGIQTMEPETPEVPYQGDDLERQSVTRAISAHLVTTELVDVEAARTKVREQAEKEAIAQFENNAITVEAEKIEAEKSFNWRLYGCLSCLLVVVVVIVASVLATREQTTSSSTLNDICSRAHGPLNTAQGVVNGILDEQAGQDNIGCQVTSDVDSGYGLWYFVKADTGSRLIASTCSGSDESPESDTQVLVFGGGSCNDLQCIGGSDELCGSHGSVGWLAEQGSTYYILVRGYRKSNTGPFSLSIDTLESNGECNDAASVSVTESPVIGSTRNLTIARSSFSCGASAAVAPGAWHRLIGDGDVVCASAVNDQELPLFPLQLSIFEDVGSNCEESSCVGGVTGASEIAWLAKDGLPYYLVVHGQESHATGDFILNLRKAPANAVCDSALAVVPDGRIVSGSLSQACRADLGLECASSVVLDSPGVWYSIDASLLPAGSMLRATLSGAVCEKQGVITSQITVFEGDSCSDLRCPTAVQGGCERLVETSVQWFTNIGKTYYLYVQSSESTMFDLIVEEMSPDVPDTCGNATRLSATGDNVLGSTIPASPDILDGCSTSTTPGVFYEVIGTGADMFASTCNPGTNFATGISVLAGTCESYHCVDSITESCDGGLRSTTYWSTVKGQSYLVHLYGNDRSEPNSGIFNLTIGESLLNDFCPGALDLEVPSITVGSTVHATKDDVKVCGDDMAAAPGVWFVTRGNGNSLTASLCVDFTDYDTQIYVYKGASCDALECIAANDDSCGTRSKVTWDSTENEMYYIFVSGFDNAVGNFEMIIFDS